MVYFLAFAFHISIWPFFKVYIILHIPHVVITLILYTGTRPAVFSFISVSCAFHIFPVYESIFPKKYFLYVSLLKCDIYLIFSTKFSLNSG